MIALLVPFLSGALFAVGLALAGMTSPHRVIGFLDVAGHWDPSLAFVMIGAIGVYATAFWLGRRRMTKPALAEGFPTLPQGAIDVRLVAGSLIFGAGWGMAGYCPGPAIVSAASGAGQAIAFCAAMATGFVIVRVLDSRKAE
ncbi:hypothetical protein AKJ09_04948 [Labilithrix luteola]|uniref:YeeE/YedE family protein n=1 Tax=Labilithrix luteola TaxID=1391654 RepID=A0A0K1PYS0_9BACT|nr:DUF6691 family protein [Labilithrix luteola]AKU98284.1 hypothetical protein AKJ09_04948 [Labilithrix luteola]